ncbi:hypothetical protein HN958_04345 [Candidatus Falkowbacteria bacterium]|jgi:hypothetical protein|nr:hypothetical protein [Candidatus Falkowbacteria bacterium]MBT7007706.1 hypothetical protein [Candidatus Falkowbacteria bacterium]
MDEDKQVEDIFDEVDAGPKEAPVQSQVESSDVSPEPVLEKKKFPWKIVIVIVVVVVIAGGALAYYRNKVYHQTYIPVPEDYEEAQVDQTEGLGMNEDVDEVKKQIEEASGDDFDFDGLTNEEEKQYKTNPRKADSDNDGLFDRDEIMFYKTDPNDTDSDNDGYLDGQEVQSGYNPNGAGKLLNFQEAKDNLNIN